MFAGFYPDFSASRLSLVIFYIEADRFVNSGQFLKNILWLVQELAGSLCCWRQYTHRIEFCIACFMRKQARKNNYFCRELLLWSLQFQTARKAFWHTLVKWLQESVEYLRIWRMGIEQWRGFVLLELTNVSLLCVMSLEYHMNCIATGHLYSTQHKTILLVCVRDIWIRVNCVFINGGFSSSSRNFWSLWEVSIWHEICRYAFCLQGLPPHKCPALMLEHIDNFLSLGGNKSWLTSLDSVPVKLQKLKEINEILATDPWLLTPERISVSLVHLNAYLLFSYKWTHMCKGCYWQPSFRTSWCCVQIYPVQMHIELDLCLGLILIGLYFLMHFLWFNLFELNFWLIMMLK